MRVLELYSGIGGMHYALRESGVKGVVIAAIEINTGANEVYKRNFPEVKLMNRNIESITLEDINNLNIDTILMSPPCQPFTRVGLQKDNLDNRTNSLFHILELIPQIKTLKYILLENVKGFEQSETRDAVTKCLIESDFNYRELILSPCQFGIPNTRHRYYLLAKKKHLSFYFDQLAPGYDLPKETLEILPKSKHIALAENTGTENPRSGRKCYELRNIVKDLKHSKYSLDNKLLQNRVWVLDIRNADSTGSCCFTKAYSRYAEGTGSIYCPYSDEVIKEKFLEASKFERGSNEVLEVFEKLKLRYFTPREVCRLMCFPEDFKFPKNTRPKQKYKLLGNSINVHVVSRLIILLNAES